MLIVAIDELTLNWCGGEARSVNKLVTLFAEPLGLGELIADVCVSYT